MLVHKGTVADNFLALKHQMVSHFALYQKLNTSLCSVPRQLRLTVPYSRADASQIDLALEGHEFFSIFYSKTQKVSVSQLNKETYCDAGFIEGNLTLSCTPKEGVDLHWDEKNTIIL